MWEIGFVLILILAAVEAAKGREVGTGQTGCLDPPVVVLRVALEMEGVA